MPPKRPKKAPAATSSWETYKIKASKDEIMQAIEMSIAPTHAVDKKRESWARQNRAGFSTWIDRFFRSYVGKTADAKGASQGCGDVRVDSISLFQHQRFIKDYIQFASPYRGILVYHGLGSGKSCSSIAAAELLTNHMDVVVMVPASLRDNYTAEIRKCGRRFFAQKQHWEFLPTNSEVISGEDMNDIYKRLKLDALFAKTAGGVWIPLPRRPANYASLPAEAQAAIDAQINVMIQNSFKFINYNGLTRKKVQEMHDEAGGNPFDNKCVVIDEIHNLVSQICNGKQIGMALYNLLMQARNCKIILLSGTPLINYPHEIAVLINIITGPQTMYEITAKKDSVFDKEDITRVVDAIPYVDQHSIDIRSKTLSVMMLPEGFRKQTGSVNIVRDTSMISRENALTLVKNTLQTELGMKLMAKIRSKEYLTLPQDPETFNEFFVDFAGLSMRNPVLFMRRILGTVSFYNALSSDLFPSVDKEDVLLDMNDYQFNVYEKERAKERLKEQKSKSFARGGDNLFSDMGQVYRFYSRAVCNFVFPENIERPFPSRMNEISKELDVDDDDVSKTLEDENTSKDTAKMYMKRLTEAVGKLRRAGALSMDRIEEYSPKYKAIYDRISSQEGCALVYSQFRKVEGLGLFAMFLEENGWCELKVKRIADGDWDLDLAEDDFTKPKFIQFTGSNEETRMLLRIFNSDFEGMPNGIRQKLELMGHKNNHRGAIIKLIMITKSGAEGISLKNVRQVHVMEPYWNHIRIDQVIGRAVRTCSHMDLPKKDRTVKVYVYCMRATKKQIDGSFSIRTQDKSDTSDQHIYNMAKKKARIIDQFLYHMQRASVDCAMNAKHHKNLRCFAFPVNVDDNRISYVPDIRLDMLDKQYTSSITQREWRGEVLRTKKGNFLLRPETQEVYDYDLYVESGRLVKLGVLTTKDEIATIA